MKKALASIVGYRLTQTHLKKLLEIISSSLTASVTDPFKTKLLDLLTDIMPLAEVNDLSPKQKSLLMDTLLEMEMLIVEYLSTTKPRR